MITFLKNNTSFEISSFRAIHFYDCVFNLTMPKWLDITNFISSNKIAQSETHFFTKKLAELKVHMYVSSKNTKKLTDISFLQACLSTNFQHK